MLQINATTTGPQLHGETRPLGPTLRSALEGTGPVVIMLHGYKYMPGDKRHCPHQLILSQQATQPAHSPSWANALGFGTRHAGLAIGFGWHARGTPWTVYRRAEGVGRTLADLIVRINAAAPYRPIHIIAHSMGARVALHALHHLPRGAVQKMILLAGAEFVSVAEAALETEAGRAVEVMNITSRENDLFDFLMERLIAPPRRGDRALGHSLAGHPRVVSLQMDDPETLAALARRGFPVEPPNRRICHWSSYRRKGLFALYSAYIGDHPALTPALLRQVLPNKVGHRWSRLLARRAFDFPLPETAKETV